MAVLLHCDRKGCKQTIAVHDYDHQKTMWVEVCTVRNIGDDGYSSVTEDHATYCSTACAIQSLKARTLKRPKKAGA